MRPGAPANPPFGVDGKVDLNVWVDGLCAGRDHLDRAQILTAATRLGDEFTEKHFDSGRELAELVASMKMDTVSVLAALFYRPARQGAIYDEQLQSVIGAAAVNLFTAVNRMADISLLDLTSSRMLASEAKDQTANIRRMLVALIDDVRVAVLKLAERVVALRLAKNSAEERKTRIATEAMTVFVPLAERLGIWRLKWELEDLSLRYLETDAYKRIARLLDGRRAEREAKVNRIVDDLRALFAQRGIDARVEGRAKHIYSIWRKMRAKRIPIGEVYDALAVRVIVADVEQCYAVLGTIHTRWRHVPPEFDDYIAAPKENGYQSIHTALIGDAGEVFEVQIRTADMHDDAELGVCAHWRYKGNGQEDGFYAAKVAWLRGVLDWQDGLGESLAERLTERLREERIFVHTPKGHVVDLSAGATPLDFAYRVHTEVGHHCAGARVDGQRVPLNTPLKTGQLVQIDQDSGSRPRRVWLEPDLGYVRTARARSKIRNWLRVRDRAVNVAEGRRELEEMVAALGLPLLAPKAADELARVLQLDGSEALFFALGVADLWVVEVVERYLSHRAPGMDPPALAESPEWPAADRHPPASGGARRYLLEIEANDREGLWRDIVAILSAQELSMVANSGAVQPGSGIARLTMALELQHLVEVARLILQLREVPSVRAVRRVAAHGGADVSVVDA